MYKLEFTLKQHTPIIHFQHDQDGATLRATEVKPKLDRFILMKLGKEANPGLTEREKIYEEGRKKAKNNGWLIDDKKGALDYKFKVTSNSIIDYFLPYPTALNSQNNPYRERNFKRFIKDYIDLEFDFLLPSPYFANADKIKFNDRSDIVNPTDSKPMEIIFAVLSKIEINIEIVTTHNLVKDEIINSVSVFFLENNFGTRQDKGFGSFTVSSIDNKPVSISNAVLLSIFQKKSTKIFSNQNQIFKFILEEYNLLKSGQNRPYKKSELFKYFVRNGIRWEKRKIKQVLNRNGVQLKQQNTIDYKPIDFDIKIKDYYNSYLDNQINDYKFIRALLGLAENFEFATYNRGRLKVKIKHIPNSGHPGKIERFKSPLFFKIIDGTVYLAINDTYKSIEGANFEFVDGRTSLGSLVVPTGFNLRSFISSIPLSNWSNI